MLFGVKKYIFSKLQLLGKRFGFDLGYFAVNGFWVTLNQVIGIISALAVSAVFARYTSKEVYGQYNFLLSIFAIISIVSIPGLNTSVLRSIARGFDGVYRKSMKYRFLWSLLGTPILLAVGWYYFYENNELGIAIMLSSLIFPTYFTLDMWAVFLHGKKKYKLFSILNTIKTLVINSTLIIAIFLKVDFPILFFSYILSWTICNTVIYFYTKKEIVNDTYEDSWKKSGLQLSSISFMSIVYNYLDKVLVGVFLPIEYLAVYAIATGITGNVRNLFKSVISTIYPKVYETNPNALFNIFKKILPKAITIISGMVFIIALVIPYIIRFLFSDKYDDAVLYAQVYLVIIPFATVVNILYSYFISIKKESFLLTVYNIGIVINMIFFFIAIPLWEIWGAVLSSLLYQVILSLIYVYFWFRYRDFELK